LAPVCDRFDADRRLVHIIFVVDETMIRIRGREAWVWVAFEPGLRVFLAFHVPYNRSILFDARTFLKRLRQRYGMKPIWTDKATSYPEGGLHVVEAGASRLPDRVEEPNRDDEPVPEGQARVLRRPVPCLKEGCDRENVRNWISVFRFYHNHVRTNLEIGRPPMAYNARPEYLRFIEPITTEGANLTAPTN
jgi:transposase-like protein